MASVNLKNTYEKRWGTKLNHCSFQLTYEHQVLLSTMNQNVCLFTFLHTHYLLSRKEIFHSLEASSTSLCKVKKKDQMINLAE